MYQAYYSLSAKPFQLKPDADFFFGSRGHKRAMAYLEYGLEQGEGFIVITGEVGAGKTTLVRNLFRKLESEKIVAAQIVNTHLDSDDTLRMVVSAFGLPYDVANKAVLLTRLEQFLRQCDKQGKRALLVVDEAQNLSPRAVEELRMLSNFQSADKALLQTFLLGQPEFRKTLLSGDMVQLLQRVIATYHLGPMDAEETKSYIEHRLHTVGWQGNPSLSQDAFNLIFDFTGGIPRKINTLCDRLFLMGYLEEIHHFGDAEVNGVIADIQLELNLAASKSEENLSNLSSVSPPRPSEITLANFENTDERLVRMERSMMAVLDLLKKVISSSSTKAKNKDHT